MAGLEPGPSFQKHFEHVGREPAVHNHSQFQAVAGAELGAEEVSQELGSCIGVYAHRDQLGDCLCIEACCGEAVNLKEVAA